MASPVIANRQRQPDQSRTVREEHQEFTEPLTNVATVSRETLRRRTVTTSPNWALPPFGARLSRALSPEHPSHSSPEHH